MSKWVWRIAALLAVLAVGSALAATLPKKGDAEQPFYLGDDNGTVVAPWGTVKLDSVDGATDLVVRERELHTPGVFLVAELTVTMADEPLSLPYVAVQADDGRRFLADFSHGGSLSNTLQPGFPVPVTVYLEVAPDALPGARLLVAPDLDTTATAVAAFDLPVTADVVARWDGNTLRIEQP